MILMVPFSLPMSGPTTREEMDADYNFKQLLMDKRFSSAIGWVVKNKRFNKVRFNKVRVQMCDGLYANIHHNRY